MSPDTAFLASLKPGDKFVLRNRRLDTFGRNRGPQLYEIVRITAKRSKFFVKGSDGKEFEIKGHGTLIEGGGFGRDFFPMLPYTPEIDAEIETNTRLIKAKNRASELQELCRLFERGADDLGSDNVYEFLGVSKDLQMFLRKRFPKTEV